MPTKLLFSDPNYPLIMSSRVVLITGANSGVGLATAKVLTSTSTDYHIIISARSLLKAQDAQAEVEAENPSSTSRLTAVQLDVTDVASIARAHDFVDEKFGRLDALINNAALGVTTHPDVYTRYRALMDTNVIGPAVVADIFRPLLLKSSNPYSIFVSSGAGSFGREVARFEGTMAKPQKVSSGSQYFVSKAALNMIALQEHIEFAEKGLKVFAMSPGFVVSNLRGPSEEMRTGWGKASPASEAGEIMKSILDGNRDEYVGKLVWKDGVYPW
jgi:NAD(P)-dependent dehydrogenase (short-subunit alcohol dehydrogenase family)